MKTNRQDGTVIFYLRVKKGRDITETKYETSGTLYTKKDKKFLFFDEKNLDDDSITKCRLEFDERQIRIRRDGQLIMEQSYVLNAVKDGYFKTPYGELVTRSKTHRYKILQENQSKLVIGLAYDLFISEDKAGKFDLKIQFEEEAVQ